MTTANETINPEAAARNEDVKAWMDAQGFARMPDIFAPGTSLYEGGNAFQAKREEIEAMTDVAPGVAAFRAKIADEHREDWDVAVADLRMVAGGLLSFATPEAAEVRGGGLLLPEGPAFKKLASIVTPPGGAQYLSTCPPNVRKFNFDFWSGHDVNRDETVKLRTRNGGPQRKLWAVTSQKYGKFDVDEVAQVLADKAKGGAKFDVIYDGVRAQMDLVYVTPIEDDRLAGTGELFRLGLRATTADDGSEAHRIFSTVHRGMCRNFGIIDESKIAVGKAKHVGSTMKAKIEALVDAAHGKVDKYLDAWVEAGRDKILNSEEDARSKLLKLCERGYLKVAGVEPEQLFQRVYASWQREPGWSRRDIWNAATRMVHENRWGSIWTTNEIESQASQNLLYVKTLNLN